MDGVRTMRDEASTRLSGLDEALRRFPMRIIGEMVENRDEEV